MAKKDKKVNAWQIIVAVFQALAALFGSLKKSHDSAKAESDSAKETLSNSPLEGEDRSKYSLRLCASSLRLFQLPFGRSKSRRPTNKFC